MAGLTKEQKAAKALLERAVALSCLSAEQYAALPVTEQDAWAAKAKEALDAGAADGAKGQTSAADGEEEPDLSGLIKVAQGDDEIHVHPSCLADHQRLGWKEV